MQPHYAVEATQPFNLLSFESSPKNRDLHPRSLSSWPYGVLKSLATTMRKSDGSLQDHVQRKDLMHPAGKLKMKPMSFKSYYPWSLKHSCSARSIQTRNESTKDRQGCISGCGTIGYTRWGGVGPAGYLDAGYLARNIREFAPKTRHGAASGCTSDSHNLPNIPCEFASDHGSSKSPPRTVAAHVPRGVHQEAIAVDPCLLLAQNLQVFLETIGSQSKTIPTHTALALTHTLQTCLEAICFRSKALSTPTAILVGRSLHDHRKAFRFRIINIRFHTADGIPWNVLALQDTGADENAISENVVQQLGYWDDRTVFTEADSPQAPLALGGNHVCPSATIELPFSTLCGRTPGKQKFNIYPQNYLLGHEVILDVTLVEQLDHLQKVDCRAKCSFVSVLG